MSFAAVVERLRTMTNPYPGLRPFETSESHLFFGRDQQVADLVARLERNRFLAIVGVSGSGKSSLARAGLIPALERGRVLEAGRRWRIVLTRPGGSPRQNLAADLTRAGLDASPLAHSSHGLIDISQQLDAEESLLVFVDQFEELFRYKDAPLATVEARHAAGHSADDAAEFVQLLLASARHSRPVYVIITMRSDYLGDCAGFRDLPETLNECQYLIPRMTREQRKQAIEVPLGQVAIAPSLVQRLLNDAGDEPDQLPVLQHALMRTWNHWRHADPAQKRRIELDDYTAIGGFDDAIDQHAEEVLAKADPAIAEKIFRRLTARGRDNRERRNPATLDELCALCSATTTDAGARVVAVVDRFRLGDATFLVPREGALAGTDYIDITHESLIRQWRRLRDRWLIEEQASAKTLLGLIDRARDWEARRAKPLSDLDYAEAVQWNMQRNPAAAWGEQYAEAKDIELLRRFLLESKSYDRRQSLRKRGLWVVVPLTIVFAGLAILASYQARQAEVARGISVARLLAAKSQVLESEQADLEPSVLLAIEALRRSPSSDGARILRKAVARLPRALAAVQLPHAKVSNFGIGQMAMRADGRLIAVQSDLFDVQIVDAKTWQVVATETLPQTVIAIAPGSPGKWIMATSDDRSLAIIEMPGGRTIRTFPDAEVQLAAFSRDLDVFVIAGENGATAYDMKVWKGTHIAAEEITSLAVSPDGRRIATGVRVKGAGESKIFYVRVSEIEGGRPREGVKFTSKVSSLAFGGQSRFLAAAAEDGTLRLLDLDTRSEPSRINTTTTPVSVALSDDARLVATGNLDGTTRVFDTSTGEEIARASHPRVNEVGSGGTPTIHAVTFSRDGRAVLSGGTGNLLRVFEAKGATEVIRITEVLPVTAMTFANHARRLVVGSGDIEGASVGVFDAPAWRETIRLTPPQPEVNAVGVSASGRFVGVASNWGGGPWIYDLDQPQKPPAALGGQTEMTSVALSGDGAWVGAKAHGGIQLFDRASGKPGALPNSSQMTAIALSEDGRTVVIGTDNTSDNINRDGATVLRLPSAAEVARISVNGPVRFVASSPNGHWVAASIGVQASLLRLIDTTTKRVTLEHVTTLDSPVAFSTDGGTLALISVDGTLRIFLSASGEETARLLVPSRIVGLSFENQDRALVVASLAPTIAATSVVKLSRYILFDADLIADACARVVRDLSESEWHEFVGNDVPRSDTCNK